MFCIFMHMLNEHATPSPLPIVVKYGGNAMPQAGVPDRVLAEVVDLWRSGTPIVLVHGGGPEIDRWLGWRGVATERIDGLRVTDAATLETTEAVLCGSLNKRIVRACGALGARAVGVSGEDASTLVARRARSESGADLGYVGEVIDCDPRLVCALLASGFLPIVAPLAVARDHAHAFNVNADLAAGALAATLGAEAFVALTNVARVLRDPDDPHSGIDEFSLAQAREFADGDACRSSMRPKLRAAIAAVEGGVERAYIADARIGIRDALERGDATIIYRE